MGEGLKRAAAAARATRKPTPPPERRPIDFDWPGRILSSSKNSPEGHVCVWNANVCIKSLGKIWFGDLDLHTDADDLRALAAAKGETVYVLREYDARFDSEHSPLYQNAVAIVEPDGEIVIDERRR